MNRLNRFVPLAGLVFASLLACPAFAAGLARLPTQTEIDCSGIYSVRTPRTVGSVISGEESMDTLLFTRGDRVYLRLSQPSTARVAANPGEQFLVVRQAKDPIEIPWFRGQKKLEKRMGRLWEDVGRVRVVRLAGSVVIARVENSCVPMERGDELVAWQTRPVPPLPRAQSNEIPTNLAHTAVGRIVSSKGFRQVLGAGYIAYVDLGTGQGAKPGDPLMLFRRPGAEGIEINRAAGNMVRMSGLGPSAVPDAHRWLPREILGQAVILRVSATAATILITSTRREIDLGDYAALE